MSTNEERPQAAKAKLERVLDRDEPAETDDQWPDRFPWVAPAKERRHEALSKGLMAVAIAGVAAIMLTLGLAAGFAAFGVFAVVLAATHFDYSRRMATMSRERCREREETFIRDDRRRARVLDEAEEEGR